MQKLSLANGFQIGDDRNVLTGPPLFVIHFNMINAITEDQRSRLKLSNTAFDTAGVSLLVVALKLATTSPTTSTQYMYPISKSGDDILICALIAKYLK